MSTLTINNALLQVKEYNNQRVITFKDIDNVHQRPEGTASRNFRTNRGHFIDGEDYYKITPDEFRRTIGDMDKRQTNNITLITETGYLMLVKSFTDDLAWQVQRELVNTYFRSRIQSQPIQDTYFDKFWKGEKVITIRDFEQFTGINQATVNYWLKKDNFKLDEDYYILEGTQLQQFKYFNTKFPKQVHHLILITYNGCIKLVNLLKLNVEQVNALGTVGNFLLPKSEMNYIHVRKSPEAMKVISKVKRELDALNVVMEKLERNNLHFSQFDGYIETMSALAITAAGLLCHMDKAMCLQTVDSI